jgi:hypothetical protein
VSEAGLRIFISYAREDGAALALKLRDDLRAAGLSPWMDMSEIPGGDNWARAIEHAIEGCEVGLALCSHKSYQSNYCRAEQMRLTRKGKRIIPILVQNDADIPLTLEHLNYLDFSDAAAYGSNLRDLLSDLNVGRTFSAFSGDAAAAIPKSPFRASRSSRLSVPEKRDAPAFRRHLAELRREPWLGGRVWWTYFLYAYADLDDVTAALAAGALTTQSSSGGRDDAVRLFFRPRTPELWAREGIKPGHKRGPGDISRPVYMLFDLESVLCLPDARFSAGDPAVTRKSFATSSAFAELPFQAIYHDGVPRPDQKDEILLSRRAQVLVPGPLTLEALQFVWCRSQAEADTLRGLLPDAARRQWSEHVTARADFALFHRRGAYVDTVDLRSHSARISLFPGADPSSMRVRIELEDASGRTLNWEDVVDVTRPLHVAALPDSAPEQPYTLRLWLDGAAAYAGKYVPWDGLV